MKSRVEIDTREAGDLQQVLEPSLDSDDTVSYSLETGSDTLVIEAETDSIGPLRGATDTVFRLSMLAQKIIER